MKAIHPNRHKHSAWTNPLMFQVNWFFCVLLPEYIFIPSTLLLLIFHAKYVLSHHSEYWVMAGFSLAGVCLDSLIASYGFMQLDRSIAIELSFDNFLFGNVLSAKLQFAPLWLICLWLSFSTCLNHALVFFHQRLELLVALTLAVIPLNYYLGAQVTGSSLSEPLSITLGLIMFYWSLLLVLSLKLLVTYSAEDK